MRPIAPQSSKRRRLRGEAAAWVGPRGIAGGAARFVIPEGEAAPTTARNQTVAECDCRFTRTAQRHGDLHVAGERESTVHQELERITDAALHRLEVVEAARHFAARLLDNDSGFGRRNEETSRDAPSFSASPEATGHAAHELRALGVEREDARGDHLPLGGRSSALARHPVTMTARTRNDRDREQTIGVTLQRRRAAPPPSRRTTSCRRRGLRRARCRATISPGERRGEAGDTLRT